MDPKIRFTVCIARTTAACWTLWLVGALATALISLDIIHMRHSGAALIVFAAGNVVCAARRLQREQAAFDDGFRIAQACQEARQPRLVR